MMTAEQLKGSILQLAMQGKLVEQRPEEGTGENLYKEIKAEKKELIKEGKIKAGKKYDPVSEEEITFDIPETWTWVRLSDVVFNRGQKKPANAFSYIDIGSIDNVHQKLNDEENIVEPENAPSRARKIVARGDIIYSTVRPYLHNMCVIDREFSHEPIASTGFATMTCHKGLYNKYLFYYLLSPDFDKYANDTENSKGVAYPAINDQKLYKALVPLPPLAEQKRIVAKIEELMPFVEQYAAASTKLNTLNSSFPEMMKKSILQEAVQGKLVPQDPNDEPASLLLKKIAEEKKRLIKEGKIKKQKPLPEITEDEIPFDIPDSWEWVRLGNIIDLLSGTDFKPSEYSDISGKTVYITGASCLTEQGVISQRWTDTPRNIASKGDLLIVCKGSGYGKTVICDVDEAHIARQIMAIKDWGVLDLNYIRFFLQSRMTYIKQSGQGVIPGIDRGTILNMVFPLPPLAEQRRIVSFTSNILETVETLGNDLE